MALAAYDEEEDEELEDPTEDEDSSALDNTEESAMDRVNEVFETRAHEDSFLPESEKEDTNLSIANAMERADIGNRFGFGSDEHRAAGGESTGLSGIPDSEKQTSAGKTSTSYFSKEIADRRSEISTEMERVTASLEQLSRRNDPGSRGQRKEMMKSLHGLEKENSQLLREQQRTSIYEAKQADERVAREAHTRAANGYRKFSLGLSEINSTTPKGPQYDKKVADWILKNQADPDVAEIIGTKGFLDKLKPHADSSRDTIKTVEKLKEAGYGVEPSNIGPQGTSYKVTPPKGEESAEKVPQGVMRDYTALKVNRAELQSYLEKEKVPDKQAGLQKKIDVLDSQIGAVHEQFPSLAKDKKAAATPEEKPQATATELPPAPRDATKREKDKVYSTPKGDMKWTGTGWLKL